jgi:hypothetical protein
MFKWLIRRFLKELEDELKNNSKKNDDINASINIKKSELNLERNYLDIHLNLDDLIEIFKRK